MTNQDVKIFRLVGSIFALVGVGMLIGAGFAAKRQDTILKTWPVVEAVVTRSEVTRGRDREGSTMYGTEVEFRYTVNGREFTTPASSSYQSSSYAEMRRKLDRYAPETRHLIRYNPADLHEIRYDVGYNLGFFALPLILGGMGLVFGGVGFGLLFASRRRRARRCPSCAAPVEKGHNFCPNCAAPLSPD